jgi:hypothetical protein
MILNKSENNIVLNQIEENGYEYESKFKFK